MTPQEKIGKNIKKARKNMGLKQSELADKAGINSNYYSRIERGEVNPSVELLSKITKVLKIKSSDVLPF